tara:strand:- start:207 stop:422 length:216 start_codon:yes stop_codon:yes gene_type:complete
MTYKHLLEELQELNPAELEQEVMAHLPDGDEYVPVWAVGICDDKDPYDMSHQDTAHDDGMTYDHIVLVTGS